MSKVKATLENSEGQELTQEETIVQKSLLSQALPLAYQAKHLPIIFSNNRKCKSCSFPFCIRFRLWNSKYRFNSRLCLYTSIWNVKTAKQDIFSQVFVSPVYRQRSDVCDLLN